MEDVTAQLENAIQDINSVKRKLQQNSTEVKFQIQTNISRHMEALRNREVWLLNQVEILQSAKEEVLHQQQARLNKQIGLVQNPDRTHTNQFDLSDLKPEESPYLTFRSDSASLRDAINTYGKVDVNGLPHAVFVKPGDPSTSLPRHFEDYDDADHHVLYKTVEAVKRSQTANPCIEISLPKLSPRREDWLAHSSTTTVSYESAPKFSVPAFNEPASKWLKPCGGSTQPFTSPLVSTGSVCSTTSSSVAAIMSEGVSSISSSHSMPSFRPYTAVSPSTQNWLKQIKHDFEDEDDFEIVEKLGSVDDDMHHLDGYLLPSSHSAPDLPQLETKTHHLDAWLKTGTAPNQTSKDVFQSYHANLAKEKVKWLSPKSTAGACPETCQKKASMDIESLGSCISDPNTWLRVEDVGEKELTWLCKAEEKCSGMSDCSGEPNCLDVYLQKAKENTCCQTTYQYPGFKHYQGTPDKKTWLKSKGKNVEPTTPVDGPGCHYLRNASKVVSDWIKKDVPTVNKSYQASQGVSFDHIQKANSVWLKADHPGTSDVTSTPLSDMPGWKYNGTVKQETWILQPPKAERSKGTQESGLEYRAGKGDSETGWEYRGSTDTDVWLHESRRVKNAPPTSGTGDGKESVGPEVILENPVGFSNEWLQPIKKPDVVTENPPTSKMFEVSWESSHWLIQ